MATAPRKRKTHPLRVIGALDASRLMVLVMANVIAKPLGPLDLELESPFARQIASALLGKPSTKAAKEAAAQLTSDFKQRYA